MIELNGGCTLVNRSAISRLLLSLTFRNFLYYSNSFLLIMNETGKLCPSSLRSQYISCLGRSVYPLKRRKARNAFSLSKVMVHFWDGHSSLIWGRLFPFLHLPETIRISHEVEFPFQKKEMFLLNCLTAFDDHYFVFSMSMFYDFSEMKSAEKCHENKIKKLEQRKGKTTISWVKNMNQNQW